MADGKAQADTRIPVTARWASLEKQSDDDPDRWDRIELTGIGLWWKPEEGHPEDIATTLWEQGQLPDGLYRAVFAPKDRRRRLALAAPFELLEDDSDGDEDESEVGAEEPEEEQELELEAPEQNAADGGPRHPPKRRPPLVFDPGTAATEAPPVKAGSAVAAPLPARLHVPSSAVRPLAVRNRRRPTVATPFDPPPPRDETSLGIFVYLHSLAEAQRDREHQLTLRFVDLMVSAVDARASAAIASEQSRANSVIAYLREVGSSRLASDLAPLEQKIAQLQEQLADAEGAAEEDAEAVRAHLDQQLATIAQQPEGPIAITQAIGQLLQSPAGELLAKGLKALFARDDGGVTVLDPGGP